jgi:hypothetical protein
MFTMSLTGPFTAGSEKLCDFGRLEGGHPPERIARMLKLVSSLAAFILVLGIHGAANAASGTALGVDPDAEARGDAGNRTLVVGADLFIGDRVVTGGTGLVQILFSDKTELVVGPNSSMVLEDYLLREDGSAGRLAINALSGTFRFVTGGAPKNRYIITTPTGTIGVRGTAFELYSSSVAYYLMGQHGSTINCPKGVPLTSSKCVISGDACDLVVVTGDTAEVVGNAGDTTGEDREKLKEWFQFAVSQSELLRQFRISGAENCLRRSPNTPGGGSISDPIFRDPPKQTVVTPTFDPFIN